MPQFSNLDEAFEHMESNFQPDKAEGVDAIFQFKMTGENGGDYWMKVQNKEAEMHEGEHDSPTMTITATADDYLALLNGELNAMAAFMQGKIKVKGDMGLALKLQSMFGIV